MKNFLYLFEKTIIEFNKLLILALIIFTCSHCELYAQNYSVAIGYGFYKNPNLKLNNSQDCFLSTFDYKLTNSWSISSELIVGKTQYFDNINSNYYEYNGLTNSYSYESHANFMTRRFKFEMQQSGLKE